MGVRYFKHEGFGVDVTRLLCSRFKRWVAHMEAAEIRNFHQEVASHPDVTGHIVIIGGLGVVDGFSTLNDARPKDRLPVIIFELRNAERFIFSELGPREKDDAGLFKPNTLLGRWKTIPDPEGYDGHAR